MGSEGKSLTLSSSDGAGVQAGHGRDSISSQLSDAEKVSSPTVKLADCAEMTEQCKEYGAAEKRSYSCCLRLRMSHLLCVVIVAVWGLLLLPIVFYHLPPSAAQVGSMSIASSWQNS